MSFLLDTNVVSELARNNADRRVVAWARSVDRTDLHLSVLTLGEISKGAARLRRRDAVRGAAFSQWLDGLREQYVDRIIAVDSEIAEAWGRLAATRSIPIIDALLAATAITRGLTLVTRNVRDVADLGLAVLNPWDY